MNRSAALLFSLFLFLAACISKPDPSKRIDMISNPNIKLHDSAFDKYYKGELFSPHIIRLDNSAKPACIEIDSAYFNTKSLTKASRDEYYKKVIALLPKQELEVHRKVWAIPEVRAMQQADGGNGTIVSWIKEVLDEKSGYYLIELKRNDIEELGTLYGIAAFRIRLHPATMEIGDESGYFVSMEAWRRTQKQH